MLIDYLAALFFALAVLHTFCVKFFQKRAESYPEGSIAENLFHLLGEVEVVFGLWAGFFLLSLLATSGSTAVTEYVDSRNFTEPLFVFVIMAMCSTRPILRAAEAMIQSISKLLPVNRKSAFYFVTLSVGPLLGSFITEPAAMTVTALILSQTVFVDKVSDRFKYASLGLLFVNVSIGGTLTPYAAPPVLMVAQPWGWDLSYMLNHFGWKAVVAIGISTLLTTIVFNSEIKKIEIAKKVDGPVPIWIIGLHIFFVALVVVNSHHAAIFCGLFLFFLGLVHVTGEYQSQLKLKESLLVAFFLGGLVVIGGMQRWWLEPLLAQLNSHTLFLGSIGLTAITDNAALTYLGTLVPDLNEASKYALVAGSVVGGGLTVIANAPNPAGYGILNSRFSAVGIKPLGLFLGALTPTCIAAIIFWIFG